MSDDEAVIHNASSAGVAASHGTSDPPEILVAPSTARELNTVRMRLIPVACWRVDDIRFRFDSSFVLPAIAADMKILAILVKVHQDCPLSIFGHADPVGSDDYNKTLSGRRATAIYAMLIRDTAKWEKLFREPFGGDNWGEDSVRVMLNAVAQSKSPSAPAPQPPAPAEQFRNFSGTNGGGNPTPSVSDDQVRSVANDSGKRRQLFLDYMNLLCGDLLLDKTKDFLARGQDAGGKGDLQGCSEFNPLLILSQDQQTAFDQAKQNKDDATLQQRNDLNAQNRRVMVLIFRKGSRVDPAKWPCPRVTEGVAACKKRFFSDGEKRRSTRLPDSDRKFDESHDTFACRFYQRLSSNSPCERILITFSFRLYDLERRFIPFAPFELSVGGRPAIKDLADDKGFAIVPEIEVPNQVIIRWGFPPDAGQEPQMIFEGEMFLKPDEDDRETEARQKLQNLGYAQESPFPDNVTAFQRDYGQLASPALAPTGQLDDATLALLRDVFASAENELEKDKPERKAGS